MSSTTSYDESHEIFGRVPITGAFGVADTDSVNLSSPVFTTSPNLANYGVFTIKQYQPGNPNWYIWQFTPNVQVANALNIGEGVVFSVSIVVNDGELSSPPYRLQFTLLGTNDAPVIDSTSTTHYVTATKDDNIPTAIDGQFTATDVDNGHRLAWSSTESDNVERYGGFEINPNTGEWTFRPNAAINNLAAGQTEDLTFMVSVVDEHGGQNTETLTITLVGADHAPTNLRSGAGIDRETQYDNTNTNTMASGSLLFDDEDSDVFGDSHIFVQGAAGTSSTFVDGSNTFSNGEGSEIVGTYGSLFLKNDGTWSYVLSQSYAGTPPIADGAMETESFQFRVQGRSGNTTVSSNIHAVDIVVRGSEVIELMIDGENPQISYGQPIWSDNITANVGGGAPRGTTTFTVALTNNADADISELVQGLDDGNIGRIEIGDDGSWAYSLTSLAGLNAAAVTESGIQGDTLASGETLTRSFYIRADNDTIQEANRVKTLLVEVTINGMDVVKATDEPSTLQALNYGANTAYIGGGDQDYIYDSTGGHIIIAGNGNDRITLGNQGEGTIYHRFTSSEGEFLNTDGGDTIRNFTRSDNTFILVNVGATTVDEGMFIEATERVELHAQTNTNTNEEMLTSFELRFLNDDSDSVIRFYYGTRIDVTGTNGDSFFGANRDGNGDGNYRVTDKDLWGHFFGDNEDNDNFQVVNELPLIINELIGNSAPVINLASIPSTTITDIDTASSVNVPDSISGGLTVTDADVGDSLTLSFTQPDEASGYGTFMIDDANNEWRFTPNAEINSLAVGQTEDFTFTINLVDGNGGRDTEILTITLEGIDDAPTNLRPAIGMDIETQYAEVDPTPGPDSNADTMASGSLLFDDIDGDTFSSSHIFVQGAAGATGASSTFVDGSNTSNNNKGSEIVGTYGSLFLKKDGTWSYELDQSDTETPAIANGAMETDSFQFRVQGRSGSTPVNSNTHEVVINVRGSEAVELTANIAKVNSYDVPASGQAKVTLDGSDNEPRGTTTFTVALTDNANVSERVLEINDDVGRIEIAPDGSWTYSLTSLAGLNVAAEANALGSTLDSGETLTRSFYISAENDTIQDGNRVVTTRVDVTIHGMDVVRAAPNQGLRKGRRDNADTVYVGDDSDSDSDTISTYSGKHTIIAGRGDDDITLGKPGRGTSTIYHRFASREDEFFNTDGEDGINDFTRNDNTFILVDVGATPVDEDTFIGATDRVELHAQTYTIDTEEYLESFELRFLNDDSDSVILFFYNTSIDVSGDNGNLFFGDDGNGVESDGNGNYRVTDKDLWGHFFGDGDRFQVINELSPVINDVIGNSAPVINLASITDPTIRDINTASSVNEPDFISGQFTATDTNSDILTWNFTGSDNLTEYGVFTIEDATGRWTFTPNAEINELGAGQTEVLTFMIRVADNNGGRDTQTLAITLEGSNDAPVINTIVNPGNISDTETTDGQNVPTAIDGQFTASDVDGDILTWRVNARPNNEDEYGVFTINNATTGDWTFTPNTGINGLDAGQAEELIFTISVVDNHGLEATETLTITLDGVNDAPVIIDPASITNTGSTSSASAPHLISSGSITAHDVDGDSLTWSSTQLNNVAGYDNLSDYGVFRLASTNSAATMWRFTPNTQAFNELAAGEEVNFGVDIVVNDGELNSLPYRLEFALLGTNDAPVIDPISIEDRTITDSESSGGGVPNSTAGRFVANDDDRGDGKTWFVTESNNVSDYGEFVMIPTTGVWRFTANDEIVSLAAGETEYLTFEISVVDNNGGRDTGTMTITLVGIDNRPENLRSAVGTDLETQRAESADDADTVANGRLLFDDLDDDNFGDSHIFVQGAAGTSNTFIDGNDTSNNNKGSEIEGIYGNLYLKNDGTWSYQLDIEHGVTQAITDGAVERELFQFRVQGRSGNTPVSSNTYTIEINVRGREVIGLTTDINDIDSYDVPASGQAEVTLIGSTSAPRGNTTFTVALNEADAGVSGLDDGTVGRIEINPDDGSWTYSLTSLAGLNAATAEESGIQGDTLDSGETLTRSFYIRASNDRIQENNRIVTMQVDVTINGMDVIRTSQSHDSHEALNAVYIGGDGQDHFFITDSGRHIVFAGNGNDNIFLNDQGTNTIYHRFTSSEDAFSNTDGGDTIWNFTRNDNTFILVDAGASPVNEATFIETADRVEFRAQTNSNEEMLIGFELRFLGGVSDSIVKFYYHAGGINISGTDRNMFFGDDPNDVTEIIENGNSNGIKNYEVTNSSLWSNFFGDEDNFQVIDELPATFADFI